MMGSVSISCGNSKMGKVPSVSLPAIRTCRQCECHTKCYAKKLERLRPTVRKAYERNLQLLISNPEVYWREVEGAIMMSRFFRFHVSGDIPDDGYLTRMVSISSRNPHCKVLCFTKRYEMLNNWRMRHGELPENLHIIFSAWDNLHMDNPYSFPVAYVRFKDGHTDAPSYAVECPGNCTECAMIDGGCWSLDTGEAVVFNEH